MAESSLGGRKDVLVSYLESNKVISIPVVKKETDIDYLSGEFKKKFAFGENVNLLLTFQKFDHEWSEYVDLDKDGVLCHKDKLKAIVTPVLADETPAASVTSKTEDHLACVSMLICLINWCIV